MVIYPNPLNASTIACARKWIETCDKTHERCQKGVTPQLPTRVLDVGDSKSSQIITLVEPHGEYGQYIALSHCWGKSNTFLTTRETLSDMKRGFQLEQAPATFHDAIIMTRKLGVRYLWIDSLCIIQRDIEDWEIESSKMGEIYRNSYLTIAASRASDDEEGFLQSRIHTYSSLKVVSPSGTSAQIYLRHHKLYPNGDRNPLASRGWTLQESYLSPRMLNFFGDGLSWDCHGTLQSEAIRSPTIYLNRYEPRSIKGLSPYHRKKPYPRYRRQYSGHSFPVYGSWYRMIEEYSGRQLTFDSDKFPALSGLASIVASHSEGNYCAGIWWEDAAYAICWQAKKYCSLKKPDGYIAPSWSWASIIGTITFPREGRNVNRSILCYSIYYGIDGRGVTQLGSVTFQGYSLQYRGEDKFGQIASGWIKLKAPTTSPLRLGIRYSLSSERYSASRLRGLKVGYYEIFFDFEDEELNDLRALFLLRAPCKYCGRTSYLVLIGILLRPVQTLPEIYRDIASQINNGHVYRRVGIIHLKVEVERERLVFDQPAVELILI